MREIWEDHLSIIDRYYCFDTVREYVVPTILTLISEKNLYGAGNWAHQTRIDHNVIEFAPKEFPILAEFYGETETYFFPESLEWILCLTHEDFSFVAGTKKFIDQIRKAFPDYKKYQPNYDQLERD